MRTGVLPLLVAGLVFGGCRGGDASATARTPAATPTSTPTSTVAGVLEANATIDKIVDGDTVDVSIAGREERVRLIGIDTPETKKPNTPVQCYGPEATAFTTSLLPLGTPVRIERDTVNRDDYGRLLGYVYRATDGIFVNYEIVRQGYAKPLSIEPNTTHAVRFVEAARAAESGDIGLWAAC